MTYDIVAKYSKGAAHTFVEWTFPRTPAIACASGLAGIYAWHYVETNGEHFLTPTIVEVTKAATPAFLRDYIFPDWFIVGFAKYGVSVFITPYLRPWSANQLAIGATLATSLMLNLFTVAIQQIQKAAQERLKNKTPKLLESPSPLIDESPSEFVKDCLFDLEDEKLEEKKEMQVKTFPEPKNESQTRCEEKVSQETFEDKQEQQPNPTGLIEKIYGGQQLENRLCRCLKKIV